MSEPLTDTDLSQQLGDILQQLSTLTERVTHLETKLDLVTDINRYGKLQELLASQDFKAADQETTRVILETLAKTRDTITPNDMTIFPCSVLQVIDQLWRKYSHERFGFSVQLGVYQREGGSLNTLRTQDVKIIQKFGDCVGWRKEGEWQGDHYDEWEFSLAAPVGCFPAAWWKSPYGLKMATFCFMRLLECNLSVEVNEE